MPQENKFNLSIIIPVFNEDQYLNKLFLGIKKYFNQEDIEVIVVNDGSNDDSYNILNKLKKNSYNFKYNLINLDSNFGKGYAVKQGAKKSVGKYILLQDADLELDLKVNKRKKLSSINKEVSWFWNQFRIVNIIYGHNVHIGGNYYM